MSQSKNQPLLSCSDSIPGKAQVVLLITPACLFFLAVVLTSIQGPFYGAHNFDPEYAYLFNSLNLATLHTPAHTDHPGTTLQVIGAAVILVKWLAASVTGRWEPIEVAVLSHPEDYLHTINFILSILVSFCLYLAAEYLSRQARSILVGVTLELSFFFYLQTVYAECRVAPEPLLLATGLLMTIPLGRLIFGSQDSRWPPVASGLLYGFGLVTKITFAPWGLVLLLFRTASDRWRFVLSAACTSVILLLPVASRWGVMAGWYRNLFVERSPSGPGLQAGILATLHIEPVLLPFLGFYIALAGLIFFLQNRLPVEARNVRSLLLAGVAAIALQIFITAPHPAPQYLLPALVLSVFLNASIAGLLLGHLEGIPRVRLAVVSMSVFLAGFGALQAFHRLEATVAAQWAYQEDARRLEQKNNTMNDCLKIGHYRSSLPSYALEFGNFYSGRVHAAALSTIYSAGVIDYDVATGGFYGFDGQSRLAEVNQLLERGKCVLMEGSEIPAAYTSYLQDYTMEPVAAFGNEGIYRLRFNPSYQPPLAKLDLPATAIHIEATKFAAGTVFADTTAYGAGIGVITSPKYPAWVEYRIELPSSGMFDLFIRYASLEHRPLRISVNGRVVSEVACSASTGGFDPQFQAWQKAGAYEFRAGVNTLRLDRQGPFPHVDELVLVSVR